MRGFSRPNRQQDADAGTPGRRVPRQASARWSDLRVWGAVGLLTLSAVLGAALLGRSGDTVLVLRAERDIAAGAPIEAVASVPVPRDLAGAYVRADADVAGHLRWPVPAGGLIPRAAVTDIGGPEVRGVTIPVDPQHAPADLAAGDVVDVWATPVETAGAVSDVTPQPVLARILVTAVSTDGVGFGGGWGVELAIPEGEVAKAVAAGRSGVIDLVAVPVTDVAVAAEGGQP